MWKGWIRLDEVGLGLPLLHDEEFLARLQKNNRVQVPVLVRWKHKLEPGEVLDVYVRCPETAGSARFYANMSKDYRITIPKIVVQDVELGPGAIMQVILHAEAKQND